MKVGKLIDVPWMFSLFVMLSALLRDYPALFAHFNECTTSPKKTSKEVPQSCQEAVILVIVSRDMYAKRCIALFEAAVKVSAA